MILLSFALWLFTVPDLRSPQSAGDWQLSYTSSGGLVGFIRVLQLSSSGELTAEDVRAGHHVVARASPDLMSKVTLFLKTAKPARKSNDRPIPDTINSSLVVTRGGKQTPLELEQEVGVALAAAWSDTIAGALVGAWRETGWTLCNRATRLTAADYDTPIDDLVIRADGTFTVTWRGGGAQTTGIPHTPVPDYSGHYRVSPGEASIQLTVDGGLVHPSDFFGDGSFQVKAGEMTLKRIWLGTRTAPRKPNVCTLTFARK